MKIGIAKDSSGENVVAALLAQQALPSVQRAAYESSNQLIGDLLNGRLDFAVERLPNVAPLIRDGRLVALAQTGIKRTTQLPDIPTAPEFGLSGFDSTVCIGVVGTTALPTAIVAGINADLNEILDTHGVAQQLENLGFSDGGGSPDKFKNVVYGRASLAP
ncbi:hypothetical protein AWV80_17880 [Cupriavidus sp. UYMU48A]|nr:hypothetical protein AWV80_17880 [Cupriavidus sp. UYMU48A]